MPSNYTKYIFQDRSGGIVDRRVTAVPHNLFGIGHTAFVSPWSDPCLHLHQKSEEFYLLRHGALELYIAGVFVDLQPNELLMILPQIPHAIVGGHGRIEYFGFRAPFLDDKQPSGELPSRFPNMFRPTKRELKEEWGCRLPLTALENQNCWLIGWGAAKYESKHLILAYLNFATFEEANAGIGTRLRMHYHRGSWEYYIALRGNKTLQIEDELVNVAAGEIVEVPPMVRHNVYRREVPYEGFTIRVPIMSDRDKVEDDV
jgi:mannose-6-phosphate isomerase-like protein (cupin superfamily)